MAKRFDPKREKDAQGNLLSKRCSRCTRRKSADEFRERKVRVRDGRQPWCKHCERINRHASFSRIDEIDGVSSFFTTQQVFPFVITQLSLEARHAS